MEQVTLSASEKNYLHIYMSPVQWAENIVLATLQAAQLVRFEIVLSRTVVIY